MKETHTHTHARFPSQQTILELDSISTTLDEVNPKIANATIHLYEKNVYGVFINSCTQNQFTMCRVHRMECIWTCEFNQHFCLSKFSLVLSPR